MYRHAHAPPPDYEWGVRNLPRFLSIVACESTVWAISDSGELLSLLLSPDGDLTQPLISSQPVIPGSCACAFGSSCVIAGTSGMFLFTRMEDLISVETLITAENMRPAPVTALCYLGTPAPSICFGDSTGIVVQMDV